MKMKNSDYTGLVYLAVKWCKFFRLMSNSVFKDLVD